MKQMLNERTAQYRTYIEDYMTRYYARFHNEPQKELFEAMEYSLLAPGKRLRPVFAFEFCRMCGGDWEKAAPFAAAVEMIHNYSLIHDDLPCMDNDDFRRGRPTNHKVYGETLAVLAGDALLTDAFAVAASADIAGRDIAFAIQVLSENAGSLGMVGGQVLDTKSEERTLTEQEVLDIQSRKTGALINAACVLGVIAAGGTQEQLQAAAGFAGALGMAFQIRDDMLDVIGTQEEMGKGVGTDANKNTFVRLYGLEKCAHLVDTYTKTALDQLSAFQDTAYMRELALSLINRTV
ncbi:MAG: polyprenyl synthetase family protein [Oscillospiraceae bacterium]|nr:polyprenyl synthetase family protein [Oscillospiraceae bacterium]